MNDSVRGVVIDLAWTLLGVGALVPTLGALVAGPIPGMGGFRVPILAMELTTDPGVFAVARAAYVEETSALAGLGGLTGPQAMILVDCFVIVPLYAGLLVWAGLRGVRAGRRAGWLALVCGLFAGCADWVENAYLWSALADPTVPALVAVAAASRVKWLLLGLAIGGLGMLNRPLGRFAGLVACALLVGVGLGLPLAAALGMVGFGVVSLSTAVAHRRDGSWPSDR